MKNFRRFCLIASILLASIFTANINKLDNNFVYASSINENIQVVEATDSLPTSYDLRNYIDIKVEDQEGFGICWAYSSLSSLETYLALQYDVNYDFSEMYLAVAGYKQDGRYSSISEALNSGGGFDNFFTRTQKDKALALETQLRRTDYPYSANDLTTNDINNINTKYNNITNNFQPLVYVNDTVSFPKFYGVKNRNDSGIKNMRKSIKQHIMDNGALSAVIYADNNLSNISNKITSYQTSPYAYSNLSYINHAITIVGWNDNYMASGWTNPGAYLCLNSWGTNFGNNGYFYVSYDDSFIEYNVEGISYASLATQPEIEKVSAYKTYPNNTHTQFFTFNTNQNISFANIIDTSKYIGKQISKLDHFVHGTNTSFYIKFFSTYQNALNSINSLNSNNLASCTLISNHFCYDKYKLDAPVTISNNYMLLISLNYNASSFTTITSNSSTFNTYMGSSVSNFSRTYTLESFLGANHTKHQALPYVIYTTNNYTINYHLNGGENSPNNPTSFSTGESLNINNPTKRGYNFIGWYTDSSFTTPFNKNNLPSGNLNLYAKFEINTYTITYNLNGGINNSQNRSSYTVHDTFDLLAPTKAGYKFIGWYTNSSFTGSKLTQISNNTGNLNVYAKFSQIYNITYKDGSNNIVTSNPTSYTYEDNITLLNDVSKLGYCFKGWYENSSFTGDKITQISNNTGNLTLYAKFEYAQYNITYNLNGGTNSGNNISTYTIDTATFNLNPASKTGYQFVGWYKHQNFSGNKIETINKGSYEDLNLYAKFTLIEYTITYMDEQNQIDNLTPNKYTIETETIVLPLPVKLGYTFDNWYTDENLQNSITQINKGSHNDITLYAKFTVTTYNIDYILDGGSNQTNPNTYTIKNKDSILLSNAEKEHYIFEGWYMESSFTTPFTSAQLNYTNVTVYAKFTPINYTITYHLPEGFNNSNNLTSYNIETETFNLKPAIKPGYEFINWYSDRDLQTPITTINEGSYGNIDLYIKYDYALPTITNKSNNLNTTYTGSSFSVLMEAEHDLENQFNVISYQWYKYDSTTQTYIELGLNTKSYMLVTDVKDSGIYCCEVTITITDPNITNTVVEKVLSPSSTNHIIVTINKKVYDMSQVKWNYTNSLAYNATEQVVELVNLPEAVKATYQNNKQTNIGNYIASANFTYDTDNTQLSNHNLSTLNWSIRKANISIKINNIITEQPYTIEQLQSLFSCTISGEYFPSNITTYEQKLNYLGVDFYLIKTYYSNIDQINVTTNQFDFYNIQIIKGEYKTVVKTLQSNGIQATNNKGFSTNCIFTANHIEFDKLDTKTKSLFENTGLTYMSGIKVGYSSLVSGDNYSLFIPLNRDQIYKKITVYQSVNNKLTEVTDLSISDKGITFSSNYKEAVFIIGYTEVKSSNTGLIVGLVLLVLAIIVGIIMIIRYKIKNNIYHRI